MRVLCKRVFRLSGADFEGMRVYRPDGGRKGRRMAPARPLLIVSMSPPGYLSAWLRPRSTQRVPGFRFAWLSRSMSISQAVC